jgi:hypothetical protein
MRTEFWAVVLSAIACIAFTASSGAQDAKHQSKKPLSVCRGLDNAACTGKAGCGWREQIVMKNGKTRRAHCRKLRGHQVAGSGAQTKKN